MCSPVVACAVTLSRSVRVPEAPMDEDRQFDEQGLVPREFDTLLQIAHRSEAPVPAGVAAAAFDRAFAQRRAGLWDGFVPDDEIDAGESYARAVEQFDSVARESDRSRMGGTGRHLRHGARSGRAPVGHRDLHRQADRTVRRRRRSAPTTITSVWATACSSSCARPTTVRCSTSWRDHARQIIDAVRRRSVVCSTPRLRGTARRSTSARCS